MPGIPHSKVIQANFEEFLDQVTTSVIANIKSARIDSDVCNIFKVSLAAHTSLRAFSQKTGNPLLAAASGIARRCTTLIVVRQLSLTRVELRRFVECVFLYIFYLDHPLEWSIFSKNPSASGDFNRNEPLVSLAASSPALYRAFSKEILALDPTGIGSKSFEELATAHSNLSQEVHAGVGAVHPSGSLALAQDRYDKSTIAKLRNDVKLVLGNGLRAIASASPTLLNGLDAIDRAWFDWMVGNADAKTIRGTQFGVNRTWAISSV